MFTSTGLCRCTASPVIADFAYKVLFPDSAPPFKVKADENADFTVCEEGSRKLTLLLADRGFSKFLCQKIFIYINTGEVS